MKDKLIRISKLAGYQFAIIENQEARHLIDDIPIAIDHIMYQKINRADGIYVLTEATCGHDEDCKVGMPQKSCVESGIYSKKKCAVYDFNTLEEYGYVSLLDCVEIMN